LKMIDDSLPSQARFLHALPVDPESKGARVPSFVRRFTVSCG
jgi:hypothetical protein